jgi:hypothetical protein
MPRETLPWCRTSPTARLSCALHPYRPLPRRGSSPNGGPRARARHRPAAALVCRRFQRPSRCLRRFPASTRRRPVCRDHRPNLLVLPPQERPIVSATPPFLNRPLCVLTWLLPMESSSGTVTANRVFRLTRARLLFGRPGTKNAPAALDLTAAGNYMIFGGREFALLNCWNIRGHRSISPFFAVLARA